MTLVLLDEDMEGDDVQDSAARVAALAQIRRPAAVIVEQSAPGEIEITRKNLRIPDVVSVVQLAACQSDC